MTTQATTPAFTGEQRPTQAQLAIIHDVCSRFEDIDREQISFDEGTTTPIFDAEATSLLAWELTDVSIRTKIKDRTNGRSTAECFITATDGRWREVEDSAVIGEELHDGTKVEDERHADALAKSRAIRLGLRSVAINIWKVYLRSKRDESKAEGNFDANPRQAFYNEIHVLAEKLDLIVDADRGLYETFLADTFDGVTSSKDLDDSQLLQLRNSLRAMAAARSRSYQKAA